MNIDDLAPACCLDEKTVGCSLRYWMLGCCCLCGIHRCYLRRWSTGCIWFLTAGVCGLGQCIDLALMQGMVDDANEDVDDEGEEDDQSQSQSEDETEDVTEESSREHRPRRHHRSHRHHHHSRSHSGSQQQQQQQQSSNQQGGMMMGPTVVTSGGGNAGSSGSGPNLTEADIRRAMRDEQERAELMRAKEELERHRRQQDQNELVARIVSATAKPLPTPPSS